VLSDYLSGGKEENYKNSQVRTACNLAGIFTRYTFILLKIFYCNIHEMGILKYDEENVR
jgi:hypothetical protein